jgi:hypothetical protein
VSNYVAPTYLELAVKALREDLLREDGPQISTVRNYNFAILPYRPEHEFTLRRKIHALSEELRDAGWTVGTIPLHSLLLARIRAMGPDVVETTIGKEKRLAQKPEPWRNLNLLKQTVGNAIGDENGLAADVVREVSRILDEKDAPVDRTVIFLGRAGALYPFLRTSALLKHVAGKTRNAPVVLLYPGTPEGETGLSFMGVMPAVLDYRPRIYR